MTQQPFSRPGAIDLSALKRPARRRARAGRRAAAPRRAGGSAYSVVLDEQNFQATLESSMTAPVLLVFYSPTRHPAERASSPTTWRRCPTSSRAGSCSASSTSTRCRRSPRRCRSRRCRSSSPCSTAGRCRCSRTSLPIEELRAALTQVVQQLTAQGVTGRHQPRTAAPEPADEEGEEPAVDPRYAAGPGRARGAATSTARSRSTRSWSTPTPPTPRPPPAWRWPRLLQRTAGRRPERRARGGRRGPRRRRGPDAGRRPRPARRPRRRRVRPAGRAGPALRGRRARPGPPAPARPVRGGRQRRPAGAEGRAAAGVGAVLVVSSTRAAPRPASTTERGSSRRRRPSGRPPAGRPGPGTASTRRSRARPRRRSGSSRGSPPCSPQTPRCRSGRAARPRSTAVVTSAPTPSTSSDSNGETAKMPVLEVRREERRLDVVAGEAPRHLGQVVGAEREELRRPGDLGRRSARPAAARSWCRS